MTTTILSARWIVSGVNNANNVEIHENAGLVFKNDKSSLKADVIEVDIKTNDIKISMYEENKKINIESTN